MTSVGIGPGVKEVREKRNQIPLPKVDSDDEQEPIPDKINVIGGVDPLVDNRPKDKVLLLPAGMSKKRSTITRSLKLNEITKSLTPEDKSNLMLKAAHRIFKAEKMASDAGIGEMRSKIISTLGSRFSIMPKSALLTYICSDFNKRIDLAFSWLYEEFCLYQGFHKSILSR